MASTLSVFKKEVVDNIRDRQTMFYALLFGPILLPLLVAGSTIATFKQLSVNFDEITELPVINASAAPNLVGFLRQNNIDTVEAPDNYRSALLSEDIDVVLEVAEDYGENLASGKPAPLVLYANEANKKSTKASRKISSLLRVHEQSLSTLRLQARGLDPTVFDSVMLEQIDVSSEGSGGQILASMLPFLLIMSMVMGGFYLAIDTTAGERERHSLEPLLSLPISRANVVVGKYLATLAFVALSSILTAITLTLVFHVFPSDALSSVLKLDAETVFKALLLASPLTVLITSLLITVAAFTRSTKEAQTYLGILMIVPMAPFFLLQYMSIKSADLIMTLPMMSQYKLLEKLAMGETISVTHILLSVSGTLLCAALLLLVAVWLYRQDRILA